MKYIIIFMITLSHLCYGQCEWKTIKKQEGGYQYSIDCHLKVGELVDETKRQKKIITLQDLIIEKYDKRVNIYAKRVDELEEKIDYPKWVMYGLGMVSMGLSVYLAGQLRR